MQTRVEGGEKNIGCFNISAAGLDINIQDPAGSFQSVSNPVVCSTTLHTIPSSLSSEILNSPYRTLIALIQAPSADEISKRSNDEETNAQKTDLN